MAARLALITTVLLIFVLGFFAPRWLGPKNCINSSLVEEITIVVEGEAPTSVETCSLFTRSFGKELPSWFRQAMVIPRLEGLENLARFWPRPDHVLKVTITTNPDIGLIFREDLIEIGPKYLHIAGVLERSLIGYWMGLRDSVTSQIATDFLWSVLSGNDVAEPLSVVAPWTSHLVSLRAYCGLGLNVLHHEEFCQVQRDLGEGLIVGDAIPKEEPVYWSVHSLVTGALKKIFAQLPLEEKTAFIQKLLFLNHFEGDDTWAELSSLATLDEIDQKLWEHVQYITSSLNLEVEPLWEAIKPTLLTRTQQPLRYFVVGEGLSWSIKSDLKARPEIVAVEQGADKYIYPSDVPLKVSRHNFFESLKLESVTVVDCETPEPSRILEFDPYVRKVLFVRMCDGSEFALSDLLTTDQEHLVQTNTKIEFMEFNLAALRFAVKTKGALQSSSKLIDWQEWLDWQGTSYDPSRSAYRPRAAIDGVNWFRTN